jgi:hypothetical protein
LQWRRLDETAENGADEGVEVAAGRGADCQGVTISGLENKRGAGWGYTDEEKRWRRQWINGKKMEELQMDSGAREGETGEDREVEVLSRLTGVFAWSR